MKVHDLTAKNIGLKVLTRVTFQSQCQQIVKVDVSGELDQIIARFFATC